MAYKIRWYLVPLQAHPFDAARRVPPREIYKCRVQVINLDNSWGLCRVTADEVDHNTFPGIGLDWFDLSKTFSQLPANVRQRIRRFINPTNSTTVAEMIEMIGKLKDPTFTRGKWRKAPYLQAGVLRDESQMVED